MAEALGNLYGPGQNMASSTVSCEGYAYNDKNECLFEHAGDNPPGKRAKLLKNHLVVVRPKHSLIDSTQEVQCET